MMLAHLTGLELGQMFWTAADCHLYLNHHTQAVEVLTRTEKLNPSMRIVNKRNSIDEFTIDDFEVTDYDPHPAVKAEVAV